MYRFAIVVTILATMMGCQLVTIQVHQRAIVDIGDNTDDDYTNRAIEEDVESTSLPVSYKTTIQAN